MTSQLAPTAGVDDLYARFRRLYTPLISDCAEELGLGLRVLGPGLFPLHADQARVVVGPAFPCLVTATSDSVEIDTLLAMVDAIPSTSVVVVAVDQDVRAALWGGLMTAGAQRRGAVGAVVDGGVRDLHQILPSEFAVFGRYRSPIDIRGRAQMAAYGETVSWGDVQIDVGDLVVADANGALAVPQEAQEAVLLRCEERVAAERATETALRDGEGARSVYARFGAF